MNVRSNDRRLILFLAGIALLLWASYWYAQQRDLELGHRYHSSVPASVLEYGTLGNVLSELGLIRSELKYAYQPITVDEIPEGAARLSFTIESDDPVKGIVFWKNKGDVGFPGIQAGKVRHFVKRKDRVLRVSVLLDSFSEMEALRFDVDSYNIKVKLSEFEITTHDLVSERLDSKAEYELLVPVGVDNLKVDGSGIEFFVSGDPFFIYTIDHAKFGHSDYRKLFGKKRSLSEYVYKPARFSRAPADISREVLSPLQGVAVLSVKVSDEALEDVYGVLTNLDERGSKAERLVDLSFYDEKGQSVFNSTAGMRYHGGEKNRSKRASFKFYFRDEYASSKYSSSLVFPEQPLEARSIVLHHTIFPSYSPIGHLLAIDLFRDIGIDTPRTRPTALVLNGQYRGLFYLTDHISKNNFERILGTSDFMFYRYKSENELEDKQALYDSIQPVRDAENNGEPVDFDWVFTHFDVEGFTNFMIANTVFNTHDYCQGALYRRDFAGETKWQMVGWDFDGAFMRNEEWINPQIEDSYNPVQEALRFKRPCTQSIVFRNLLKNSQQYRDYFWFKFEQALQTIYSTEAMIARLDEYRKKYQGRFGVTKKGLDLLEAYFKGRPDFVRKQTRQYLDQFDRRYPVKNEPDLRAYLHRES